MSFVTNPIGIIGEAEAAKMLEAKGYKILEHNWRMGHLEVDLIAESKEEILFVEVKALTSILNGKMPEENVDETKRRRVVAAANAYIKPFSRMMNAMREGRHEEALRLHYTMLRMNQLIFADGNPAGIKCLMSIMGLCKNVLRLPLVTASETVQKEIENEYNNNLK